MGVEADSAHLGANWHAWHLETMTTVPGRRLPALAGLRVTVGPRSKIPATVGILAGI